MNCAYIFAALALISLPASISGGLASTIQWVAQTFLQLVLLSVIMVGQKVQADMIATHHKEVIKHIKRVHSSLGIEDK
jgi:hypothetical protein